jgi:hypothetical protein
MYERDSKCFLASSPIPAILFSASAFIVIPDMVVDDPKSLKGKDNHAAMSCKPIPMHPGPHEGRRRDGGPSILTCFIKQLSVSRGLDRK